MWLECDEQENCWKMAKKNPLAASSSLFPNKMGLKVTERRVASSYLMFQINGEVRLKWLISHFVCEPKI